ncbi:MAG: DUF4406 domain-containing protein [Candidatus Pacearchaeota archaeon]|nr:DUF4406 domain-containing protein [Candidatus Pacearchaeota archaeon]
MKKYRVYIAGKLNSMAVDYIKNVHAMLKEAEKVRKAGFSVYVPCLDFLIGVYAGDYNYKDYFENSISWLEASDAVYACGNWKDSNGAKKEIERANELGIPVFYDLENLVNWREQEMKKKSKRR